MTHKHYRARYSRRTPKRQISPAERLNRLLKSEDNCRWVRDRLLEQEIEDGERQAQVRRGDNGDVRAD